MSLLSDIIAYIFSNENQCRGDSFFQTGHYNLNPDITSCDEGCEG